MGSWSAAIDHGFDLLDVQTFNGKLPPQSVSVGLKAITVDIHVDGIVIGTGFPGSLGLLPYPMERSSFSP